MDNIPFPVQQGKIVEIYKYLKNFGPKSGCANKLAHRQKFYVPWQKTLLQGSTGISAKSTAPYHYLQLHFENGKQTATTGKG